MEEPINPISQPVGRPPYQTDEERRAFVVRMAKLGISHCRIAKILDIDPKTLRKHFKLILAEARLEADANVIESLYDLATSRRSPIASIFWAKTRCGYKNSGLPDETDTDDETSQPPPTNPAQPPSLENFTVYNNEGEPNASE